MRISFLLSSLGLSGGVRVVVEYANRLSERGHVVTLVAPGQTRSPEMLLALHPSVRICESDLPLRSKMNGVQKVALTLSLAHATPPSDRLVATHTPTTLVSFLASKVLRKGRAIWLFQDYAEMFAHRPFEFWLMRHALRWHEMVLSVSSDCKQELARFSAGRIVVVGEGLSDAHLFQPLPHAQRPKGPNKAIFYLGDQRPRKGLQDFLAAAVIAYAQEPQIELWIALKDAESIPCDLPHRIIHRPSRQALIQLYSTCHLFVSASWREGFGLPPLEAMACATPVVLTDSGGVREFARDGVNCLMVPPRQPAKLAEAMLRVLCDDRLAEHLSKNAAQTPQQFSWDAAVDRFEEALLTHD